MNNWVDNKPKVHGITVRIAPGGGTKKPPSIGFINRAYSPQPVMAIHKGVGMEMTIGALPRTPRIPISDIEERELGGIEVFIRVSVDWCMHWEPRPIWRREREWDRWIPA